MRAAAAWSWTVETGDHLMVIGLTEYDEVVQAAQVIEILNSEGCLEARCLADLVGLAISFRLGDPIRFV
jgi:hypothetical protein